MRKVVTVAILVATMAVVVALNWDALTSNPNSAPVPVATDATASPEAKPLPLPTVGSTSTTSTTTGSPVTQAAKDSVRQPSVTTTNKQPEQETAVAVPTQPAESVQEPAALDIAKQAAARFAAAAPDKALTTHRSSTDSAKPNSEVSPSVSQEPRTEVKARKPVEPKTTPTTKDSKALSALDKAKMAASSFAEAISQGSESPKVTGADITAGLSGADVPPKRVLAQALAELPKATIEALPQTTVTQIAQAVSAQTEPGSGVAGASASSGLLTPFEKVASAPRAQLERLPQDLLVEAVASISVAQLEQLSPDLERIIPAALDTARTEIGLDAEARRYIRDLTSARSQPILASHADHFVGGNQRLTIASLGDLRTTSLAELSNSDSLDPNMPLTIVRESEKLVPLKAEAFTTSSASQLAKPIRIVLANKVVEVPVHEALTKLAASPEPIQVVETVRRLEATTLAKLTAEGVLTRRQKIEVLTRTAEGREQRINELLGKLKAQKPRSIFYVRTVQPSDVQGIWGIIQSGLIDNFALGMAVRRGESVDRYRVDIPRDADEPLADASSSFLGRLIHSKTSASTVVNVQEGRIVTDPNFIQPGQQIVIVDFSGAELVAIYRHFSRLSQRASPASG